MGCQIDSTVPQNFDRRKAQTRLDELSRKIEESTHEVILLEQKMCLIEEDIQRCIDEENKLAKQLDTISN